MDTADKLVLKLLQYAGNHAGGLLQQANISRRFSSDGVSVGRYQKSDSGNSTALFGPFFKEDSLFVPELVSFHPIFSKKHKQIYQEPVVGSAVTRV